ncbi:hypothetical protein WJX72_011685 [[Myrmecia] bisecta]|uniref:Cation/H+ exchanger transmembrane domain-containing protein n=1 Tax=[Myrmecia] bisecta TaxID=41462 RepID=A0AAW1R9B1_9CHLO
MKRAKRQVACITLGIALFTWVYVFAAMMILAPFIPITLHLRQRQVEAIASLAATLMIARSPASAIAVLKETDGKGPFCSLVMAVVVVKDVLVFLCFALNIEFANTVMKDTAVIPLLQLVEPLGSLLVSILLGLGGGSVLGGLLQRQGGAVGTKPAASLARQIPQLIQAKRGVALVLATGCCIFWTAQGLKAEPLLACVLAGIITTNRRTESASKAVQEELSATLTQLMPVINVAFFGLAGATLKLGAVLGTLWIAVVVWAVRLGAIYCGSWVGCWLGRSPTDHRRRMWYGMVTQAGVALGLAKSVATRFPDWGPEFATIMVSVVVMNLIAGPPMFRSAVISAGEARALGAASMTDEFEAEADAVRDSSSRALNKSHSKSSSNNLMALKHDHAGSQDSKADAALRAVTPRGTMPMASNV